MIDTRTDNTVEVYTTTERLMRLEAEGRLPDFHGRQRTRSLLSGQRGSRMRGRGLDFDELRRYSKGDDIRHLDWRATQRTGTPLVRSYTEERDRPTLILCDQRMDMLFGSTLLLKATAAAEVAALIAWVAFHAGDRVGGLVFNDQEIDIVTPHRSRQRVADLLSRITCRNRALHVGHQQPRNRDQIDRVLSRTLAQARHDQTICIVSDFSGLTERTLGLLQQLSQHNDVLAVQIYDPLGMELPDHGVVTVVDNQAEVTLDLGHAATRERLTDFMLARFRDIDDHLRRSHFPHIKISTALPTLPQLRQALGLTSRTRA